MVQGGQQQICSCSFAILWLKYYTIVVGSIQCQRWRCEDVEDVKGVRDQDPVGECGWPFLPNSSGTVSWSSEHLTYFQMVLTGAMAEEYVRRMGERSGRRRRLSAEEIEQISPGDIRGPWQGTLQLTMEQNRIRMSLFLVSGLSLAWCQAISDKNVQNVSDWPRFSEWGSSWRSSDQGDCYTKSQSILSQLIVVNYDWWYFSESRYFVLYFCSQSTWTSLSILSF